MFDGLLRFLGRAPKEENYTVKFFSLDDENAGYFIVDGESPIAGPYKRAADAQGQLTRMRKSYTAGARRPRG